MNDLPVHDARIDAGRAGPVRATILLVLVALSAWSAAVARGGFAFDDREAIDGNPIVQGDLPATAAFGRDYWHHRGDAGHYRPLAALALRADRAVWGERAAGFHSTNVLLHVLALVLAACVLARVLAAARGAGKDGRAGARALFAGLLPFAAHPVLADSVAWISGRTSMIAAIGGAGTCLAAVAGTPLAGALLGGGALLFGLLGKEDAVVYLPAALLLAGARSRRHAAAMLVGGASAVGLALALRFFALGELVPSAPNAPLGALPLLERLRYGGRALLESARILAWPLAGPPNYRAMPGFTRAAPPGVAALLGWLPWLAAVGGAAWILARARLRRAFAGRAVVGLASVGLAALALLPVLQLIPAGEVFAPRFLYPPLLLAAPFCAATLGRLPRGVLALLAAAFVAGAWVQSGRYADRGAYARATLAHAPDDARSWNDLGLALEEDGRLAEAVDAYGRATRDPSYGRPWSNLGRIALERGATDGAIKLLERAVARAPDQPIARLNLASARLRAGDAAGAARDYQRATELAPGLAPAWRGLGDAALRLGDAERARAALTQALALDPGDSAARALLERVR